MGKLPLFVKRIEKDGTVVNTLCATTERALRKIKELHADSHAEAWIEDMDGNVIDQKTLQD